MIAQLIGNRYRILRKVGEGGMAIVYIAVDEKLGRDIAIKILKDRYENNSEIRLRFQHEAHAISNFDHPNILKIYDFSGEDSRQLWIVTELIHGRNLAEILGTTTGGWLHPLIASSIVREACKALATAHDQGIVHRDVKPDNIMITHQGTVKLMDFGIAKIQRISSMTQTGMFMGSPSYMSPEQVRGRDIDTRSDIYSLGVLFYELTTGKLPYTGASTADIAMRILSGEYVHPKFIMAGIPSTVESCIVRCLELQPDNRYQNINDIGGDLDNLLRSFNLDQSNVELERCFKNPKAYGERLSELFKTSSIKSAATVIVESPKLKIRNAMISPIPRPDMASGDLSEGSQRRLHLLPQRSTPHVSKHGPSGESIEAHLPNRRQQQREIKTQLAATGHSFANGRSASDQATNPQENQHANPRANPRDNPRDNPSTHKKLVKKINDQDKLIPNRPIVRPMSRIVPAVPRRVHHKIQYIFFNGNRHTRRSSFLRNFVIAAVALICLGLYFPQIAKMGKIKAGIALIKIKTGLPSSTVGNDKTVSKMVNSEKSPITTTVQPPISVADINTETSSLNDGDPVVRPNTSSTPTNGVNSSKNTRVPTAPKKANPQGLPTQLAKVNSTQQKNTNQFSSRPNSEAQLPTSKNTTLVSLPAVPDISEDEVGSHTSVPASDVKPKALQEKERPQVPTTNSSISIASSPASEIYIDGTRLGTTNAQGATSGFMLVSPGSHQLELKRSGFTTFSRTIVVTLKSKQIFGPYSLVRGDQNSTKAPATYKLTLGSNLIPVTVSIVNVETRKSQAFLMKQPSQTLTLDKGVYEVSMDRTGDVRKRRIDFSGTSSQLTFSVEFRSPGSH